MEKEAYKVGKSNVWRWKLRLRWRWGNGGCLWGRRFKMGGNGAVKCSQKTEECILCAAGDIVLGLLELVGKPAEKTVK